MKAYDIDQKRRGVIMLVSCIMAFMLVEGTVINREVGEDHGEGHSGQRHALLGGRLGKYRPTWAVSKVTGGGSGGDQSYGGQHNDQWLQGGLTNPVLLNTGPASSSYGQGFAGRGDIDGGVDFDAQPNLVQGGLTNPVSSNTGPDSSSYGQGGTDVGVDVNAQSDLSLIGRIFGGNFLNLNLLRQGSIIWNLLSGLFGQGLGYARYNEQIPSVLGKIQRLCDRPDEFLKDGRHEKEYGLLRENIAQLIDMKQKDGDQFYEKDPQRYNRLFEDINHNCDSIMGNSQFGGIPSVGQSVGWGYGPDSSSYGRGDIDAGVDFNAQSDLSLIGRIFGENFLNLNLLGQGSILWNLLSGLFGQGLGYAHYNEQIPSVLGKIQRLCDRPDEFLKDGRHKKEYGLLRENIAQLIDMKQKYGDQFYEKDPQRYNRLFEDINHNCDSIMGNSQFGGISSVGQSGGWGYNPVYANENSLAQINSWIHQFEVLNGPGRLHDRRSLLHRVLNKLRHLKNRLHLKRGLRRKEIVLLRDKMAQLLSWTQQRGYGHLESNPQFVQFLDEINSNMDTIDDGYSDVDRTQPSYTQYKEQSVDKNSDVGQVPQVLDLNPRISTTVSEFKTSEKGVKRSVDVNSGADEQPYIDPKLLKETFGSPGQFPEVDEKALKEIFGESPYQSNVNNQDNKESTEEVEKNSNEHGEKFTDNESLQNEKNKQSVSKLSSLSTSNDSSNIDKDLKDGKLEESVKVVGMESDASNEDENNQGLISGGKSKSASSSHDEVKHQTDSGLDLVGLKKSSDNSGQKTAVEEKEVTDETVETVSKQKDESSGSGKSLGDNKHGELTGTTWSSESYTTSSSSSNDQDSKEVGKLTNPVHVDDDKEGQNNNSEKNGHEEYSSHQSSDSNNTKKLSHNNNLEGQVLEQPVPDVGDKTTKTYKQGSTSSKQSSWSSSSSTTSDDQDDHNSGITGLKQSVPDIEDEITKTYKQGSKSSKQSSWSSSSSTTSDDQDDHNSGITGLKQSVLDVGNKEVSGSNEHDNGLNKRSSSSSYTSSSSTDESEGQDSILGERDLNKPDEESVVKKEKRASRYSTFLSSTQDDDDSDDNEGVKHSRKKNHKRYRSTRRSSNGNKNGSDNSEDDSLEEWIKFSEEEEPSDEDSQLTKRETSRQSVHDSKERVKHPSVKTDKSRTSSSSSNDDSEDQDSALDEQNEEEEPDWNKSVGKSVVTKSSRTSYSSSSSSDDSEGHDSALDGLNGEEEGESNKSIRKSGIKKYRKSRTTSYSSSSSSDDSNGQNSALDGLNGEEEEEEGSNKSIRKSGITKHTKSRSTSYSSSSSSDQGDQHSGVQGQKQSVSLSSNKEANDVKPLEDSKSSKVKCESSNKPLLPSIIEILTIVNEKGVEALSPEQRQCLQKWNPNSLPGLESLLSKLTLSKQ